MLYRSQKYIGVLLWNEELRVMLNNEIMEIKLFNYEK